MYKTFKELKVQDRFKCNGNLCIKQSRRTAKLIKYEKVFYFGQNEIVEYVFGVGQSN